MSMVLLILLGVLGVSLAALLHAIRVAPDGEESEAGYQAADDPAPPPFRKKSRVLDAAGSRVPSRPVHAA
jgi:hypothetical protein